MSDHIDQLVVDRGLLVVDTVMDSRQVQVEQLPSIQRRCRLHSVLLIVLFHLECLAYQADGYKNTC